MELEIDDLGAIPDFLNPAVIGVLRFVGLIPGSVVGVMVIPDIFNFSGEIYDEVGDVDFVRRMLP